MNKYFTLAVRKELSNFSYVTKMEKGRLTGFFFSCTSIESTLSSQTPMFLLALVIPTPIIQSGLNLMEVDDGGEQSGKGVQSYPH